MWLTLKNKAKSKQPKKKKEKEQPTNKIKVAQAISAEAAAANRYSLLSFKIKKTKKQIICLWCERVSFSCLVNILI